MPSCFLHGLRGSLTCYPEICILASPCIVWFYYLILFAIRMLRCNSATMSVICAQLYESMMEGLSESFSFFWDSNNRIFNKDLGRYNIPRIQNYMTFCQVKCSWPLDYKIAGTCQQGLNPFHPEGGGGNTHKSWDRARGVQPMQSHWCHSIWKFSALGRVSFLPPINAWNFFRIEHYSL